MLEIERKGEVEMCKRDCLAIGASFFAIMG